MYTSENGSFQARKSLHKYRIHIGRIWWRTPPATKWSTERTSCILCVLPQDLIRMGSLHFLSNSFSPKNSTHVQYSRLDSSRQNLESNGVWPKDETGSVNNTFKSRPESVGSIGNTLIVPWVKTSILHVYRSRLLNRLLTCNLSPKSRLARITCNMSRKVETSTPHKWHTPNYKNVVIEKMKKRKKPNRN